MTPAEDRINKVLFAVSLTSCRLEIRLMFYLNNILNLLCDVSATAHRAYRIIGITPKHHASYQRDMAWLGLCANCLLVQVPMNPLLSAKRVAQYIVPLLGLGVDHLEMARTSSLVSNVLTEGSSEADSPEEELYNNIDDWCGMWYKITLCVIASALSGLKLLRNARSKEDVQLPSSMENSLIDFKAILNLLQAHCGLSSILKTRPDLLAVCMHKYATTVISLILHAVASIADDAHPSDCSDTDSDKLPHNDGLMKFYRELLTKSAKVEKKTEKAAAAKSEQPEQEVQGLDRASSCSELAAYARKALFACCFNIVTSCARLSTQAYCLPVFAPVNALGPSKTQNIHTRPYLSTHFVQSLLQIIIATMKNGVGQYLAFWKLKFPFMITPLKSTTGTWEPSSILGFLSTLKNSLTEAKYKANLTGAETEDDSELIWLLGSLESQVHLTLYTLSTSLDTCLQRSDGPVHFFRFAFCQSLRVASTSALLHQHQLLTSVGETNDWITATGRQVSLFDSWSAYLRYIEENFPLENAYDDLSFPTVLSDTSLGAWRVASARLKLAVFDKNITRMVLQYIQLSAQASQSALKVPIDGSETMETVMTRLTKAFEHRHQIAREVLKLSLHSGEWEGALELIELLLQEYTCALRCLELDLTMEQMHLHMQKQLHIDNEHSKDMHTHSDQNHKTPVLEAQPSWFSVTHFSGLSEHLKGPFSSAAPQSFQKHLPGQAVLDQQQRLVELCELEALGEHRLRTLSEELKRAGDTFEDRLRHDKTFRALPLYYTLRWTVSPFGGDYNRLEGVGMAENTALLELLKSCGYAFVSVMDCNPSPSAVEGEVNPMKLSPLDASLGISEKELWIVIKYDTKSFNYCPGSVDGPDTLEEIESHYGPRGSYSRLLYQVW